MNTPSPPPLPESARQAWDAYMRMEETKNAHFAMLAELAERERDRTGTGSLAERNQLAGLLQAHDLQVQRFREAMRELAARDADAHRCLVEHITAHNARLGGDRELH